MFDAFVKQLKNEIQKPLPGSKAQFKMAPSSRKIKDFYNNNNGDAKKSAVLILLYPYKGSIYTAFIKRQIDNGHHSGQIGFPGGKYDLDDRNLFNTAKRETNEEIGVDPKSIHVIGHLSELHIPVSNIDVLPIIGYCKEAPYFKPNPDEVLDVISTDIKSLYKEENKSVKDITINNINLQAPYYIVGEYHIWGATAMMLSEFIELTKKIITL